MYKIVKKKVGILGFGNMGSVIAERIKFRYNVSVFDKDVTKIQGINGIKAVSSILELLNANQVIILAVKPQNFQEALQEIKSSDKDKLIISIAAGISTGALEKALGSMKVVRVMPNLPARVGKGMICICKGKLANKKDLSLSQQLFDKLGKTMFVKEEMMDKVTAISGSGPGYNYYLNETKSLMEIKEFTENEFIPTLTACAIKEGFGPREAKILAEITGRGSVIFLEKTGLSAKDAWTQVASKGGTTEAGIKKLREGCSLGEAVEAAKRRAEELSGNLGDGSLDSGVR